MNSTNILWVGWDSRGPASIYIAMIGSRLTSSSNCIKSALKPFLNSDAASELILTRDGAGMNSRFKIERVFYEKSIKDKLELPESTDYYYLYPDKGYFGRGQRGEKKISSAELFTEFCSQFNFQTEIPRLFGFYRVGPAKEFIYRCNEKYYLHGQILENLPSKEKYSIHESLGYFKC